MKNLRIFFRVMFFKERDWSYSWLAVVEWILFIALILFIILGWWLQLFF